MNNDTVDSAGGIEAEPGGAETQLVDALNTLVKHDDQWRVTPAYGCMTVTRSWPDGSVVTLIILSPETAYAVCEDHRGRKAWSIKGTLRQLTRAARNFDLDASSAPLAPPELAGESGRDDRA